MNVAFLFNSDAPEYDGIYGYPIKKKVLGTGVLQSSDRRMRFLVGDVTTFAQVARRKHNRSYADLAELEERVYQTNGWDRLIRARLEPTFATKTVYCFVFQNMTSEIADKLHTALEPDQTYLGAMAVDFPNPLHLVFFRNTLIELCRLENEKCNLFYTMGEDEDPDIVTKEIFEAYGYVVEYEDRGARRTIFDNYDTLEHFKRVERFRHSISELEGLGEDRASDFILNLEELHPYLFDILFAALDVFERAETREQLAQASLSGRRFLEHLADALFPPAEESFSGRKGSRAVGKTNYKNRLWAFIENTMDKVGRFDENEFIALGREADRLIELFNSGLHHSPSKEKVGKALVDLVVWTSGLIEIDPAEIRKPYGAYQDEMREFLLDVVRPSGKGFGS